MPSGPKMEQGVLIALKPKDKSEAARRRNGDTLPGPPQRREQGMGVADALGSSQYQTLLNGIPLPTVTWRYTDGEFVLVDFNAEAVNFFGTTSNNRIGFTSTNLYPDHPEISLDLERAYHSGERIVREMRYTTRTQPARRLHMRFSYAACPPDLVLMFCEDMSQGMQFWEDRKKAEQQFRALFDAAPVGIYQTGTGGRFEHVNLRLARMYGFASPDEMELGVKDPSELFVDQKQRDALQRALAERGAVDDFECLVRHADGSTFWVSKSVKQIRDGQGNVLSSMGFEVDISERKMAENLREEVERITRHDLKSPLNAVVGLANLLQDDENLTDDQVESLRVIEHSGNTMLNMINLSLAMYRMERGAYTVKAERIDLLPLLAEVLTELETTLSAHKVKADIRIRGVLAGPGAGFFVIGERLLCWALLYHLVQNAVEASPPGERVHIHFDEDKSCCVSVHNMGMVPDKIRDTLFDKFITEGKKEGTGLGAYCARLVVQTLGGSISYTSTKAEGTTMRVRLPLPPSGCF